MQCDERTRKCVEGAWARLDDIGNGKPPGYSDLGGAIEAHLIDVQGDSIFRIDAGSNRRFEVDMAKQLVTYEERQETAGLEGHAVAPCSR